jgi:hypothetical protein
LRAAAAEIGLHRRSDIGVGRRRISIQQRLGAHDHPGGAVAALRRLLIDKRLLQRSGSVGCAEPLDRRDAAPVQHGERGQARIHGGAIDDDGTRAALAEAATELGAVQPELIAQHVKQRRRRIGLDLMLRVIDRQGDHPRSSLWRISSIWRSNCGQAAPCP